MWQGENAHGKAISLFRKEVAADAELLGTYRILYTSTNATPVVLFLSDTIAVWAALGRVIRMAGSRSFGGAKPGSLNRALLGRFPVII